MRWLLAALWLPLMSMGVHESFVHVASNHQVAEVTFRWHGCGETSLSYVPAPSGKYKHCGAGTAYVIGLAGMEFWKQYPRAKIMEAQEEVNSVGGIRKVIIRFNQ